MRKSKSIIKKVFLVLIAFAMFIFTISPSLAVLQEFDVIDQPNSNIALSINGTNGILNKTIWVNSFNTNITLNFTDVNNISVYSNYTPINFEIEGETLNNDTYPILSRYIGHFGINVSNSAKPTMSVTTSGNVIHKFSNCLYGGCYEFNGTSAYISLNEETTNIENMTACTFVYLNATSGGIERLFIDNWVSITDYIIRLGSTNKFEYLTKDGGTTRVTTSTTTAVADTWYHICGTYSDSEDMARIYINGIQENNNTHTSGSRVSNSDNTYFGSNNGAGDFLNGTLDEIMIASNWLSDYDIQTIYNNSLNLNMNIKNTADVTPPTINVTSPQNTTYNYTTIPLNVFADEIINTWWYILNGGNETIFTPNITIDGIEGSNIITVYANDTSGNIGNQTIVYFAVDTGIPPVFITSPLNQSYTDSILNLEVYSNEDIDVWWYSLNYGVWTIFSPNTTINVTEGHNNLIVYANDTVNNTGYEIVNFYVDTIDPTVTIDSPLNETYNVSSIPLNVYADETISTWEYSLNYGSWIIFTPNTTITPINESNTLEVRANDTLGNSGSAFVYFYNTLPETIQTTEFTGYSFINLETTQGVLLLGILVFFYIGLWVIGFQFKNFGFCSMGFILGFFLGFLLFNIHWILTGMMFLLNASIFMTSARMK